MINVQQIVSSGIIEEYCLGIANESDKKMIESIRFQYPEIELEIAATQIALETYSTTAINKSTSPGLKNKILSIIDNFNLEEKFDFNNLPLINQYSDIKMWNKHLAHIKPNKDFENEDVHMLNITEEKQIFLVFLKKNMSEEAHTDCEESILLLEGTCYFRTGNTKTYYEPGAYIKVPTIDHEVIVTSKTPLKFIVQRLAKAA